VLIVDAGERTAEVRDVPDEILAQRLGGKGLGTHLLDEHSMVGLDPLSPSNPVIFAVGPVTDTRIPGSCRYGVFTKSPQTGFYSESYSGGKAAEKISRTGLDAVLVTGASDTPVYLEVYEGMGLAYATSDRGACHLRSTFYKPELSGQIPPSQVDGKAELFVDYQDRLNVFDGLILCRFFWDFYPWPELAEVMRLTTGLDLDQAGLREVARHIADQSRRFNVREGLTEADDWLPPRFFDEPLPENGAVLTRDELAQMRSDYYRLRGWNEAGHPPD
jgi:aldehyde:ferredoxin oxidoreductase